MPDNSIRLALLNFCDKQRGGVKIKYANDNSCQRDGSRWLVHWSFNMFFSGERAAFPHKARNQNTKRHNKSQPETWRFQRHTIIFCVENLRFWPQKKSFIPTCFLERFESLNTRDLLLCWLTAAQWKWNFYRPWQESAASRKNKVLQLPKEVPKKRTNFKDIKKGAFL